MKTHVRALVIGGGVVGVSTLYHLAKKGWSDIALIERTELTAGSTWHAAGLLPLFNMSYTVGQLHKYSVDLYKRLPAETGQDVSFHVTGNLRLATCRERMDEYQKYCGTANTIGVPFEVIGPAEVKELWPLIELGGSADTPAIIGALHHPDDGHIAPADLTMALRKGARAAGAEIYEHTEASAIERTPSGEWRVRTGNGDITAEHIVLATGNYARQTGRMLGLNVPAIPVEHQYIVYDESAELKAYRQQRRARARGAARIGQVLLPARGAPGLDPGSLREGGAGALRGRRARLVRQEPVPRRPRSPGAARRGGHAPRAGARELRHQGHRQRTDLLYPGWQPAHRPGLGPAERVAQRGPQLRHHRRGRLGLAARRVDRRGRARHRHAGGGPASLRRLHRQALRGAEERGDLPQRLHHPLPRRGAPDARPAKTSPVYDKLAARGAVWGQRYGWERANWFAPPGVERRDHWSFRRSNYFQHVGNEARLMRERVGVIDLTPFTKHEVTGPGAESWLDGLVANKVPTRVGRLALSHALTRRGGIRSEFTITRIADGHYYVVSSGAAERYDSDYLLKALPRDGSVGLRNITNTRGCFVVAGPKSREVLGQLTDTPLDNGAFPWLTAQVIEAGLAVDVYALRVNFVGALGWELHFPIEYAHHLFDALFEAGRSHGIGMVGMRAMESLRMEKSYRMWGSDMTPDYTPFEAGLDRFVRMNKGPFIGREALEKQLAAGVPNRFVTLEVHGVKDADPLGNEPLFERGGRIIGRATSGYYGHCLKKSLAIGYARSEFAQPGTELTIEILGERKQATVLRESPYDPDNLDLRA